MGLKPTNSIFRFAAVIMTLLLLCTVTINTFHEHDKQIHSFAKSKTSVIAKDDCKICEYSAHHHFNQALTSPTFTFDFKVPELPQISYGGYSISFYQFTLQGFTNKGPPVVLA